MKNILYFNWNYNTAKKWQIPLATLLVATLLLFLTFSNAQAQCPFNSEYRLYGSANIDDSGNIELTPNLAGQKGQAWSKKVIDLRQPFTQKFDLFLGENEAGGDGFAFVLRGMTPQLLGTSGGGLGFGGIRPSLAFEYDTYNNTDQEDHVLDHFALQRAGGNNLFSRIGSNVPLANLENSAWHTCTVSWNPVTQEIKVYFDGLLIYTTIRDIIKLDFYGNPNVILGFTASTGVAFNLQRVCIKELTYTPFACASNDEYIVSGNASFQNSGILLTQELADQAGQAWSKKTIDLRHTFTQVFDIYLGRNDAGADGFAFVLRGNTNKIVGLSGYGLGYAGITPSLAFEFDTFNNGGGDLINDHFALHTGGNANLSGRIGNAVDIGNIEDANIHQAIVDWEPSTKTIRVVLDDVVIYTAVRDIVALDFAGNPNVTIGFTASTGTQFNMQNVCINSLTYTPCNVGEVAPSLSASTVSTACPIKTANLNNLVTSTIPSGTRLEWFTNAARTGTAISTPTAAGAGTYYAFYRDAIGDCYSPASAAVTVNTQSSICADLSLTASPIISTKNKGESITYTCTLSNAGPDAAPNTKIQISIPENTTLQAAIPSQGTFVEGNNVWEAGTVASGANLTITITVIVN